MTITGRALYEACQSEGINYDPRGWLRKEGVAHNRMGEWSVVVPALPDKEKAKWERAALRLSAEPSNASDRMSVGHAAE